METGKIINYYKEDGFYLMEPIMKDNLKTTNLME
jgi:hypothetical protein